MKRCNTTKKLLKYFKKNIAIVLVLTLIFQSSFAFAVENKTNDPTTNDIIETSIDKKNNTFNSTNETNKDSVDESIEEDIERSTFRSNSNEDQNKDTDKESADINQKSNNEKANDEDSTIVNNEETTKGEQESLDNSNEEGEESKKDDEKEVDISPDSNSNESKSTSNGYNEEPEEKSSQVAEKNNEAIEEESNSKNNETNDLVSQDESEIKSDSDKDALLEIVSNEDKAKRSLMKTATFSMASKSEELDNASISTKSDCDNIESSEELSFKMINPINSFGSANLKSLEEMNVNKEGGYINGEVIVVKKVEDKKLNNKTYASNASKNSNSNINDLNNEENTKSKFTSENEYNEFRDLLDNADSIYKVDTNVTQENNKVFKFSQDDNTSSSIENNGEDSGINRETVIVKTNNHTTDELIEKISNFSDVESVEPNYIYYLDANTNPTQSIEDIDEYADNNAVTIKTTNFSSSITDYDDLTANQWGYKDDGDVKYKYSIKVPDWNDSTKKNSDGTVVAVIDTGIELNHPDLQNVIWDGGNIPALTKLGGGKYGYNSMAGTTADDETNSDSTTPQASIGSGSHGTHVAGIIAAEWNGHGTSGVCNGTKVLSIRAFNSHAVLTSEAALKAYNYLIAAKKAGINIVSVNNSWGGGLISTALDYIVQDAGKLGIVSVFSSGNSAEDNDVVYRSATSFVHNKYAIIVNNSTKEGYYALSSCYGQKSTDVAAPGSAILSSVALRDASFNKDIKGATALKTSLYEKGKESQDFFKAANIKYDTNKTKMTIDYDDPSSLVFKVSNSAKNQITFTSDAFDTALKNKMQNNENLFLNFYLVGTKGNKVNYNIYIQTRECDNTGNIIDPTSNPIYVVPENCNAFDYNESYQHISISLNGIIKNGNKYYKPVLDSNDKISFKVETTGQMGIYDIPTSNYTFYILRVNIYGDIPYPYASWDGTSMSAPAVSGAIAIVAKKFGTESADKWVARIKASTFDGSNLKPSGSERKITNTTSITGGIISVKNAVDEVTKPVVFDFERKSISGNTKTYEVSGYFFGSVKGKIKVGKYDLSSSILSWTDEKITFSTTNDISFTNGEVLVTRNDNKYGHNFFNIDEDLYTADSMEMNCDLDYADAILLNSIYNNGNIYLLGRNNTKNFIFKYNPNTKKTTTCLDYPSFEYKSDGYDAHYSMVEFKNKIYVDAVKTSKGGNTITNGLIEYDISTGKSTFIELDYSKSGYSSIRNGALYNYNNSKLYMFGGYAKTKTMVEEATDGIFEIDLSKKQVIKTQYKLPLACYSGFLSKDMTSKYGTYVYLTLSTYIKGKEEALDASTIKIQFNSNNISTQYIDRDNKGFSNLFNSTKGAIPFAVGVKNGFYILGSNNGQKDTFKYDTPNKTISEYGLISYETMRYNVGCSNGNKGYFFAMSPYTKGKLVAKEMTLKEIDAEKEKYVPSGGGGSSSGGGGGGSGTSSSGMIVNGQVIGSYPITSIEVKTSKDNEQIINVDAVTVNWKEDNLTGKWHLFYGGKDGQLNSCKNGFVSLQRFDTIKIDKIDLPIIVSENYYFNEKGEMQIGWITTSDNKKYFFDNEMTPHLGAMCKGWKKIEEGWYYFNTQDGAMFINGLTPDGYKVDKDGKWVS